MTRSWCHLGFALTLEPKNQDHALECVFIRRCEGLVSGPDSGSSCYVNQWLATSHPLEKAHLLRLIASCRGPPLSLCLTLAISIVRIKCSRAVAEH